jgi:glycosyltransferase involved in cell wall biosynthesis
MTAVLVYSNDRIGRRMAGPAIRSYHFALELAREFDVTLMARGQVDVAVPGVEVVDASGLVPRELERSLEGFDAIVAQFLPLPVMRRLARRRRRVVYDVYIPFVERLGFLDSDLEATHDAHAERLFARTSRLVQRFALATGSAFVCASERQRDMLLGMLTGLGRIELERFRGDPRLRDLVDVVPSGVPTTAPVAGQPVLKGRYPGIGERDRVVLWAGGIWNWLDPATPIRAIERISTRRDDVKLLFLGLERPVPVGQTAVAERAVELARSLGVLGRSVFFHEGWVPYEDRQAYLLEADLGVSAHLDTLEARFAFRTRLVDYIWAGLPILTTEGDVLADVVAKHELGRAVAAHDVGAWESAIEAMLGDPGLRARTAPGFAAARERLAWPASVAPLARLVREAGGPGATRWRADALLAEDAVLRLRTSLALGGARGLARRRVARLGVRVRSRG